MLSVTCYVSLSGLHEVKFHILAFRYCHTAGNINDEWNVDLPLITILMKSEANYCNNWVRVNILSFCCWVCWFTCCPFLVLYFFVTHYEYHDTVRVIQFCPFFDIVWRTFILFCQFHWFIFIFQSFLSPFPLQSLSMSECSHIILLVFFQSMTSFPFSLPFHVPLPNTFFFRNHDTLGERDRREICPSFSFLPNAEWGCNVLLWGESTWIPSSHFLAGGREERVTDFSLVLPTRQRVTDMREKRVPTTPG